MNKIKFNVECEMDERWVNQFMSFLEFMQYCGSIGHSCQVSFFADGDGDFRPHFKTDVSWQREYPKACVGSQKEDSYGIKPFNGECVELESFAEVMFDAG